MLLRELQMRGGGGDHLHLHTAFNFHYYKSLSLNTPIHNNPPSEPSPLFIMSHGRSSKRHRTTKVDSEEEEEVPNVNKKKEECSASSDANVVQVSGMEFGRRKLQAAAAARLRSVVAAFSRNRSLHHMSPGLSCGRSVVGTLFGSKRGHVHLAFQKDPVSYPALLIELAMPVNGLVKEMASGLVRIKLECDKIKDQCSKLSSSVSDRLLQEPVFRTYCNGKRCGFATRRECGEKERRLFKAVEPISMGAGVIPGNETENGSDEITYMRAKFERIVGSRDSEAFYMLNPDSKGAPELSVYLLRV